MKILLIEDDVQQRRATHLLLQAIGHQVAAAAGGGEALALAALFQPDVVFLDLQMPQMDGYEVARRLRLLPAGERYRIVLLTASTKVSVEAARAAGCDALVRKPAALSALLAALHGARAKAIADLAAASAAPAVRSDESPDAPHALSA